MKLGSQGCRTFEMGPKINVLNQSCTANPLFITIVLVANALAQHLNTNHFK